MEELSWTDRVKGQKTRAYRMLYLWKADNDGTYGFPFWFNEKIPLADEEKRTQFS